MKIILSAFGVLKSEYDAPIRDLRQSLYLIHRDIDFLASMMQEPPYDVKEVSESVFRKARFEYERHSKNGLPIFIFKELV